MRPPNCVVCHRGFPAEEGGLVYFKRTEADEAWHRDRGMRVGHPPEARWFCGQHIDTGRRHAHLTAGEALNQLRNTP